jgi:NMD protein affecting ribosome stability and mRNA decay
MQSVRCKQCGTPISKVQRDSHRGMCGSCWI